MKNETETTTALQKIQILKKLKDNDVFSRIHERWERQGILDIQVHEAECYNMPTAEDDEPPIGPRSNGLYDVEGCTSVDVSAYYYLNFRRLRDWKVFLSSIVQWLRDGWEFRSIKFYLKTNPFSFPWSQWVFVVDSLDALTFDVCYDIACKEPKNKYQSPHDDAAQINRRIAEIRPTLTRQQLIETLEGEKMGYIRVSPVMWVCRHDPTCMCVDESLVKYDLRDGWSHFKIGKIIRLWLWTLFGNNYSDRYILVRGEQNISKILDIQGDED